MHIEQKTLEQKNLELADKFREKCKGQQQLQKLYQSLKQQQLAAGMELAAEHDADHVLQEAGMGYRLSAHRIGQPMHSRGSNGSGGSGGRSRTIHAWENQHVSRAGLQSART